MEGDGTEQNPAMRHVKMEAVRAAGSSTLLSSEFAMLAAAAANCWLSNSQRTKLGITDAARAR